MSKTILKIGAHRQVSRRDDRTNVRQHFLTLDCVVALPGGKGISGAGGRQSLKAQVRQQPRRTDIPGIGYDECPVTLMQRSKRLPLFSLCRHVIPSRLSR